VPRSWLVDQLLLADRGIETVAGIVDVDSFEEHEMARIYVSAIVTLSIRMVSGAYFCDADTPESTVQFLQHLQKWNWS
jgi:hypothetical protein